MKKRLVLGLALALVLPAIAFAQVQSQNQLLPNTYYGSASLPAFLISNSSTASAKLAATTTPFFKNFSFGTATGTTFIITGTAKNCNGTSALTTSSTGLVGCTAQPQGTVTGVNPPLTGPSGGIIGIQKSNTTDDGYLAASDWNIFNNKISSTSLSGTGGTSYNSTTGVISSFSYPFPANATTTALTLGGLTLTNLAGGGTLCVHVNNSGTLSTTASDCGSSGGTVTSVTATYPIISSGGTTPNISTGFSTTSNSGMGQGNLYVGSGGIFQTAASSSIFGYVPLNPTRQLTVAGTANQITSSAGAQDLSADRTWTLSLPNHVIFPAGGYESAIGSTTNATSTNFAITGAAANCNGTSALTTNSTGVVGCTTQPQGTVTAVSVATANGFAGSSSGGATPALTLTTSITGVLKGNGTAISAASNGTDFTLITANTCGAGNFFNAATAAGVFTCGTPSSGAAYPFTPSTFGIAVSATTTPILDYAGLITATSTIGTLVASSSITNQSVKSALVLNGAGGLEGAYTGTNPCSANQAIISLSATGVGSCSSTFLIANQTITLSGDVSGSGATSISTTIGSNVVTYAKFQQVGANKLLGNVTSATANVGEISTSTLFGTPTPGQILAFLNGQNTYVSTTTLNIGGNAGTATALAANGTNCSAGNYPLGVDASGNVEGCTAASTGTVTAVSVATANGFAGSSSGGATPALTITTSVTSNVLKGNGTAIVGAVNGTDYSLITANTCSAGQFFSAATAAGVFTCGTPSGSSFAFPWTPTNNFGINTNATSTAISFFQGIFASSTSVIASTTFAINGNVGIGTSSPAAKLTIVSTASADATPAFVVDGATGSFNADMVLNRGSNTGTEEANIDFNTAGVNNWQLGIQNNSTSDFELWDGSNDPIFTVKSGTQTVGFGTTTPFGDFAINADYGDVLPGNLIFNVASSSLTATTSLFTISNTGVITTRLGNALILSGGAGTALSAYGGAAACTNQVVTAISATGGTTCATVADAMLASTFVKTLTVTTAAGVSGSFTAGATPVLSLTLGALTGVTSLNGLVVTANTGVITTGTWNGTTIAEANGGTNATSIGANMLTANNGASTIVSTSTPTAAAYLATTTTATSTFQGGFEVGTTTQAAGGTVSAMVTISNFTQAIGGILLDTWTNVVNAFTIKNATGVTVFNVDTTATLPAYQLGTTTISGSTLFSNPQSQFADIALFGNVPYNNSMFLIASSSQSATSTLFSVNNVGHVIASSTNPVLSACGTTPAIKGDDTHGEVTMGTTATGCTITFGAAWSVAPVCTVTDQSQITSFAYSVTATAVTIVQTSTTGNKIDYMCEGLTGLQ